MRGIFFKAIASSFWSPTLSAARVSIWEEWRAQVAAYSLLQALATLGVLMEKLSSTFLRHWRCKHLDFAVLKNVCGLWSSRAPMERLVFSSLLVLRPYSPLDGPDRRLVPSLVKEPEQRFDLVPGRLDPCLLSTTRPVLEVIHSFNHVSGPRALTELSERQFHS